MTDFINRLVALSAEQRALLLQRLGELKPTQANAQLMAYFVAKADSYPPDTDELRHFLKNYLPDYMIPRRFISLDTLPLTPNGKIDRKALPDPNQDDDWDLLADEFEAPGNPIEAALAKIWETVLSLETVSIHDNFFEVGGDSILSIQIVAKASQAGLKLAPNQLFQTPTIAELALAVGTGATIETEQETITGKLPLTPIQHWFFEQPFSQPHHWNQSILLELPAKTKANLLNEAFRHLLHHHDALRLSWQQTEQGWQQEIGEATPTDVLQSLNLSSLSEAEQEAAITQTTVQYHQFFDLNQPPLLRACLFELGPNRPKQLVIIAHHLIVDGISWQILLEDLNLTYRQLAQGEAVSLPPKTTSYKQWAETLPILAEQLDIDYWLNQLPETRSPLPLDETGANTEATVKTVTVSLSKRETQHLLYDVAATYNTQANDLLLAALAQTLWQWAATDQVVIGLEGHGREPISADLDLSRTVGWFTSFYPVTLSAPTTLEPGALIKATKEQLRQVPDNGIGYGIRRYLGQNQTMTEQLASHQPQLLFNYLGHFNQMLDGAGEFKVLSSQMPGSRATVNERSHPLEINVQVADGLLQVEWAYSQAQYQATTIANLAGSFIKTLQELIAHCLAPEAGGFTPADFPETDLNQAELDDLLAEFSELVE